MSRVASAFRRDSRCRARFAVSEGFTMSRVASAFRRDSRCRVGLARFAVSEGF